MNSCYIRISDKIALVVHIKSFFHFSFLFNVFYVFIILFILLENSYTTLTPTTESSETLSISSVGSNDSGTYQCIADNGIPPSIESNFTLTIRGTSYFVFIKCRFLK